jgi:hypothetical protein
MVEVFNSHPELKEKVPIDEQELLTDHGRNNRISLSDIDLGLQGVLDRLLGTRYFIEDFSARVKRAEQGDLVPIVFWAIELGREFGPDGVGVRTVAEQIYLQARGIFGYPEDFVVSNEILSHIRDGPIR